MHDTVKKKTARTGPLGLMVLVWRLSWRFLGGLALGGVTVAGCQSYDFVFQPNVDREGTHLRFAVQQPSKADILFVIDNSNSMEAKQNALKASIGEMLEFLAPQDTAYRIGIVSTDAQGFQKDCCGELINQGVLGSLDGNAGDCSRCNCVTRGSQDCDTDADCPGDQTCDPSFPPENSAFAGRCVGASCLDCVISGCEMDVLLNRPHDGARGRLVAAYDPFVFDINAVDAFGNPLYPAEDSAGRPFITPPLEPILNGLFPSGPNAHEQVPWVIDRESIRAQACEACACETCSPTAEGDDLVCFETCAKPIARALVTAYFNSNVNGLGTSGYGWEEGIKSALLAVGIDPLALNAQLALDPGSYLTAEPTFATPAGPNTIKQVNELGIDEVVSWVREDALLAIMFVTDEEDCSMSSVLLDLKHSFEVSAGEPAGSVCYQRDLEGQFLNRGDMAELLTAFKGSPSRVTVGVIGGVRKAGAGGRARREGIPNDCISDVVDEDAEPTNQCACMGVRVGDDASPLDWCKYTTLDDTTLPVCDTMSGRRYVELANQFRRRTFDSVCRSCDPGSSSCQAFGPALRDFAQLATLACFQLGDVRPAHCNPDFPETCNPDLIEVKRASRDDVDEGIPPSLLPRVEEDATTLPEGGGWFYNVNENAICLQGLDRAIGDIYDIFILHTDEIDFKP